MDISISFATTWVIVLYEFIKKMGDQDTLFETFPWKWKKGQAIAEDIIPNPSSGSLIQPLIIERKIGDIYWNTSLAAPGALAHRLQRRTACQWAP